jgi:hypothetical protein
MKFNKNKERLIQLKDDVENFLGTPEIDTKDRSQILFEARIMYYVVAKKRNYSLSSIGKIVNRHHATVIHGITIHNNYMEFNKTYKILFDSLMVYLNMNDNNVPEMRELISKTSKMKSKEIRFVIDKFINPYLELNK